MSVATTAANGFPAWGSSGSTATGSVVAGSYSFTVKNSDNTSTSSAAYLEAAVGGTAGGHPQVRLTIPSGTSWLIGARNDDSDSLYITTGTDITTNKKMILTTAAGAYFASTATQWGLGMSNGTLIAHSVGAANGAASYGGGTGSSSGGNVRCTGGSYSPANEIQFCNGNTINGRYDANGNFAHGSAALATSATDGFIYIPTCAGTPTGVPTTYTGRSAFIYDTSNNKLYVYNGAWKATGALT